MPSSLLMVDDDPEVLELTGALLRGAGHHVLEAASGAEALVQLREHRPELVLLDVEMSPMSGLEVLRRIRETPALAGTFVVMLSGVRTSKDDQAEGLETGADGYITRPFQKREFLARIDSLLRLQRTTQALQFRSFSLDNSPHGALLIDKAGRVLYANRVAVESLQRSVESLLTASIHDLSETCDAARMEEVWSETAQGGVVTLETRFARADATRFPVEVRIRQLPYRGEVFCSLSFADITERLRLAEQLRESEKLEAIGRLAAGIAHDFNNLLTGIVMNASIAMEQAVPGSSSAECFADILLAADQAAALARQLLAYSSKQVLTVVPVEVAALVRNLGRALRYQLGEEIEIVLELTHEPCVTEVDPIKLEQALHHLAVRAVEAMPNGGCLTFRVDPVGDNTASIVRIEVEDDGERLDEDGFTRLFDPYHVLPLEVGQALGLAEVFGVVRQHHGSIRAEHAPERGTIFTIELPRSLEVEALRSLEAAPSPVRSLSISEAARGVETILVVDEEEPLRRLVGRILSNLGYDVLLAGSLGEARAIASARTGSLRATSVQGSERNPIAVAQVRPVDLLITDVMLRDGNGRTLANELLEGGFVRSVLFTSSTSSVHDGGKAMLARPFGAKELLDAIQTVLATVD